MPADGRGGAGTPGCDPTGEATLELFRENDAYTVFLLQRLLAIAPRPASGRILEVGCGIGNVTRLLLALPGVDLLHAIDFDPSYVKRVEADIADPRLRVTAARAEEFCPEEYRAAGAGFDVIVSSNVLEHIEDHERVLRNFRGLLRPEGFALLLVPAHRFLYCALDRNLSHFRRYSRRDFFDLASRTGLRVIALRHFNPLGAFGWWLNGKVLGRGVLPGGQLSLYTRFAIPISRWLDRLNPFPVGVSILCALGAR